MIYLSYHKRKIAFLQLRRGGLEAISKMEHNKALGPYGFPTKFYQKFWQVIKFDMMTIFSQLQEGDIPLYKLNSGLVTLLPKKEDTSRIEQYCQFV
jgi:hypothetical protein